MVGVLPEGVWGAGLKGAKGEKIKTPIIVYSIKKRKIKE